MNRMRLIDADCIMEHVYRDKLDSRELIAAMVQSAPTVCEVDSYRVLCEELKAATSHYRIENNRLKGEIKALAFAVQCNGVSGNEVKYEAD